MTIISEIYKCNTCGNIVEVVHSGVGQLVCCGKPMELQVEKVAEEGNEKHLPVIETDGKKFKVKVGSIPHPMEEKHFIELIEVLNNGKVVASYHPRPGEKPEAEWTFEGTEGLTARAYCNVHGLWSSK